MGELVAFPAQRMRRDREPWRTKADVAQHLGVSERWIELQYQHGFPYHKDSFSRLVRFRLSEVDQYMERRQAS